MEPSSETPELNLRSPLTTIWRVLQYPTGLIVATLVSVLSGLSFATLRLPMHILTGFFGVFIGSLFFIPGSRLTGAIFLSVIGIAFFYVRFVWYDGERDELADRNLRLVLISVGALIAVVAHAVWHSRLSKGAHRKVASPKLEL